MQICKQLFDLSKLFEKIKNLELVAESYRIFAKKGIKYCKEKHANLTVKQVLQDTIDTCLIIAKRGSGNTEEKSKFIQLQKGIKAFGTGFLMSGNFRIDDAVVATAKVGLLSAKLLINDLTPIQYYRGEDIKNLNLENCDWNFLNKLKRQLDKSSLKEMGKKRL